MSYGIMDQLVEDRRCELTRAAQAHDFQRELARERRYESGSPLRHVGVLLVRIGSKLAPGAVAGGAVRDLAA
jgi:hypothetical protein